MSPENTFVFRQFADLAFNVFEVAATSNNLYKNSKIKTIHSFSNPEVTFMNEYIKRDTGNAILNNKEKMLQELSQSAPNK